MTTTTPIPDDTPTGIHALAGRVGYAIREGINEVRCGILGLADALNACCFAAMDRLDNNKHITYYRRLDRGI